ncbi:NlpC/P60 family protein [Streptomyces sp. NPDC053048]|uniref:C40 family peptidase n=1 Tax=Streptomyces sp. NPDC053048 TaxID=3365694 RepID=UPI0037CFBA09
MAFHRRPSQSGPKQPGTGRGVRVTVLSAAVATAAAALTSAPATARPGGPADGSEASGTVKSRLDRLYEQAERATEKYNAAGERTRALRERVERATDRVARGQEKLNRMRSDLGMIATAQYRNGAVDPALELLLSSDPDGYLDKASTLDRITGRQAEQLRAVLAAQRGLRQERQEATRTLAELERSRRAVEAHKREVEGRLAAARRLLNSLPEADREEYARSSRSGERSGGPYRAPALPRLSEVSGRGYAAAMAVRQAIGSPYAWGATGPGAFDCSGLMQWAYGRAGVGLPRTSQAQRNAGRRVSLAEARPGDLVIYRDDASHVGMYVGNGQVVHAPYPGARVRYDPADMMPISSVTRP